MHPQNALGETALKKYNFKNMAPHELCPIHVDFDRKLPKIVVVTCLMGGHECVFRPIRKMFEETSMSGDQYEF